MVAEVAVRKAAVVAWINLTIRGVGYPNILHLPLLLMVEYPHDRRTKHMGNMESREGVRSHPLLPEFMERGTIGNMVPGEFMAARCIALRETKDRRVWLDPQLEVYEDLSEEHPLLIHRTDKGFVVDAGLAVEEVHYRWLPDEDLADISSKYGVEESEWIVPIDFLPKLPQR